MFVLHSFITKCVLDYHVYVLYVCPAHFFTKCVLGHTKLIFPFWPACMRVNLWAGNEYKGSGWAGNKYKRLGLAENEYNGLGWAGTKRPMKETLRGAKRPTKNKTLKK